MSDSSIEKSSKITKFCFCIRDGKVRQYDPKPIIDKKRFLNFECTIFNGNIYLHPYFNIYINVKCYHARYFRDNVSYITGIKL